MKKLFYKIIKNICLFVGLGYAGVCFSKRIKRWKKGEKIGEDGANFGALVSIMLGAIKELDNRLQKYENVNN